MISSVIFLCLLIGFNYSCSHSPIRSLSLGIFIRRRAGSSARDTTHHRYESGLLDFINRSERAMSYTSPVSVIRCSNGSILVSYTQPENTSSLLIDSSALASPIANIGSSNVSLLLTGLSGDCVYVRKDVEMFCLNYENEFGSFPDISRIAQRIAEIIRSRFTSSLVRPLFVEGAVIDVESSTLLAINCDSQICETEYIMYGDQSDIGNEYLAEKLSRDISIEETKSLAEDVLLYESDVSKLFSNDESQRSLIAVRVIHIIK